MKERMSALTPQRLRRIIVFVSIIILGMTFVNVRASWRDNLICAEDCFFWRTAGVALSVLKHSAPLLTYHDCVAKVLCGDGRCIPLGEFNQRIRQAVELPNSVVYASDGPQLHTIDDDDKGASWWYIVSFLAFGFRLESPQITYFLLFFVSCIMYWISFRRNTEPLLLLLVLICGHYALVLHQLYIDPCAGGTMARQRTFVMLAAVPAVHLAVLIMKRGAMSRWILATAVLQAVVLMLTINTRSTALAQLIFLACFWWASMFYDIWTVRLGRPHERSEAYRGRWDGRLEIIWGVIRGRSWPVVVAFGAFLGLLIFQALQLHAMPSWRAGKDTSGHVFWHSVLTSMQVSPTFNAKLEEVAAACTGVPYDPGIVCLDRNSHAAVCGYRMKLDKSSFLGWQDYEIGARNLVLQLVSENPWAAIDLWSVKLGLLCNLVGSRTGMFQFGFRPWIVVTLLIIALISAFDVSFRCLVSLLGLVFLAGIINLLPVMVYLPAIHVMYDFAVYTVATAYLLFMSLIYCGITCTKRIFAA